MPPWAWDQGTQQQTRLIEAYAEHLWETLGQEPDSGLNAQLTATACCLQHQKQLWLVHRSVAVQREVENSPVPLGTASLGPLMLGTSLQAMLQSAAPNTWISPSPDREKVQLSAQPLQLEPYRTDCLSVWEMCPFPLNTAASSPVSQLDSIFPFSGAQIQASTIL